MSPIDLHQWQWRDYTKYHSNKTNLLIHLFAVPVFLTANLLLIFHLLAQQWAWALLSLAAMALSMILQGKGHATEAQKPVPFTSKANAFARIFTEQWLTYPRFFLSGAWWRAWQAQ
jgi:phage terminase small subunit